MKTQHIARLEEQLERLVEGAFTHFFGKKVHAHDIALELVRAMEDGAEPGHPGDPRPLAPDRYTIHLNSEIIQHLLNRQPQLTEILSQHMVELAGASGYRLNQTPVITLQANNTMGTGKLTVEFDHSNNRRSTTAILQRVAPPQAAQAPINPHLLMNGRPPIPLLQNLVNLGRSRDNQIVIEDTTVSRHHLQFRLRAGRFMVFDTQSQAGTFINGVRVKEHILQAGDVIRIGNTQMVYMEDQPPNEAETGTYPPIE